MLSFDTGPMFTFETTDGFTVTIDPKYVATVVEYGIVQHPISPVSGTIRTIEAADIVMKSGDRYRVLDPNRTVARQISGGKK